MGKEQANTKALNPVVLDTEIWNSKGVQIVLNKISSREEMSFDSKIETLRELLKYPGMWDELNMAAFIGVFYKVVRRHHGDIDDNITMQSIWRKFEWVRREQLMEKVTISTEDKVQKLLNGEGKYANGFAGGMRGIGALSVGK